MSASARSATVDGFEAIDAGNDELGVTLVPALGAKLTSLCDRTSGREWLWASDRTRTPLRRHASGTSYVAEADSGGWDECFPTVAPCRYPVAPRPGLAVPDHGELWTQAWETVVSDEGTGIAIHSSAAGERFAYAFERTVTIPPAGATLRLAYRATNHEDFELAVIWSAHPLLAIEAGSRVHLPAGAAVHVWSTGPETALADEPPLAWPPTLRGPGGAVPGREAGVAAKFWTAPLAEGWAALSHPDGSTLRFTFDPGRVPQVGVWVNLGGWAGDGGPAHHNLALEPCIGAQDSLEHAVTDGLGHLRIAPAATVEWDLIVTLHPPA